MNLPERFVIDGLPPSSNHAYDNAKRWGRRADGTRYSYIGRKLKPLIVDWKEIVTLTAQVQRVRPGQKWRDKRIRLTYTIRDPVESVDLDNAVKYTMDAIAKTLGFNDRKIADSHSVRLYDDGPEQTVVTLEEMA
jgi:Holliday junction resolvase RusA-like endonuclease